MVSKSYKLDIFKVLDNIRAGNMDYYDTLSPIEKKGFYPVLVYHWLIGSASTEELKLLDAIVNPILFSMSKHPKVIYQLMVSCMVSNTKKKHRYMKKGKKQNTDTVAIDIIKKYYECSSDRANEYYQLINIDDIKELGYDLGFSDKDIKKVK